MSFMEKVKFWKKHDDFSFDQDITPSADPAQSSANVQHYLDSTGGSDPFANPTDTGLPPDPMAGGTLGGVQDPMAMNQVPPSQGQQMAHDYMQSQQPQSAGQQQQQTGNQDQKIEMMNLKLDAIKSELDALNQHIKKLEVMMERSGAKRW